MPTKAAEAPSQSCPGMTIQGMPGIDGIEPHQASVTAALPRNSSAAATSKVAAVLSGLRILIVALPPDAVLVASQRRAVQPLVHAPQAVEAARVGRVGVIDHAVLERERAHAGAVARERGRVGAT